MSDTIEKRNVGKDERFWAGPTRVYIIPLLKKTFLGSYNAIKWYIGSNVKLFYYTWQNTLRKIKDQA